MGSTNFSVITYWKRLISHEADHSANYFHIFNFSFCSHTAENILVRWLDRVPNCQSKFLRTASLTSLTILSGYNLSAKNTLKKNQDPIELNNKKQSHKNQRIQPFN